jgi:transcriptional regulator with XRE-family HTH domain
MPSPVHTPEYQTFLERLRLARQRAKLTQKEVAAQLGKPQNYVSRVETGERRIDPVEAAELAAVYEVSLESLLISPISTSKHIMLFQFDKMSEQLLQLLITPLPEGNPHAIRYYDVLLQTLDLLMTSLSAEPENMTSMLNLVELLVRPIPSDASLPRLSLRPKLSDEQWAHINPKIPLPPGGRRPRNDNRKVIEAILFILSGHSWHSLPSELGSASTAWRRFREWEQTGAWTSIWQAILESFPTRDKLDWARSFLTGAILPTVKGSSGRSTLPAPDDASI